MAGAVEQVLFVHREVDVYKIPPRTGASGWKSGEWLVSDRIFTGRIRVVAVGEALEVRLEDANTGELFGVAPVPPGQAHIAVEQAADSSRNFVLRLEDAASRRHAFVGVSFSERSTAFDFNVSISDHERQQRRAAEMQKISGAADPLAAAASLMPEAAALYRQTGDLSLKEGETIKITVKKKESSGADGESFLSRLGHSSGSSGGGGFGKLMPLAPPPGESAAPVHPRGTLAPPPAAAPSTEAPRALAQHQPPAGSGGAGDLLGFGAFDSFGALGAAAPSSSSSSPAAAAVAANNNAAPAQEGWATFD